MNVRICNGLAAVFLGLSGFLAPSVSSAEDANLTDPFYISSLQYRSQLTGYATAFDCNDCLLIEGAGSVSCGQGFVLQGGLYGSEEAKLMKSLLVLAYSTGKQIRLGYADCVQWNGAWRARINRVYLY